MDPEELQAREPPAMAQEATGSAVQSADYDTPKLIVLGLAAGAYIGLGGMLSTVVAAGAEGVLPYGLTQLLAGLTFTLGLLLVLIGGAELFTGNTLMVIALPHRQLIPGKMLYAWVVVYLANFAGSILAAALVFGADIHTGGDGAVGLRALTIASNKTDLSFVTAFLSGILANMLVCLAVWLYYSARTTTDMVFAIVPPIAAFVAVDSEHSVANMYLIPFGMMVRNFGDAEFWSEAGASAIDYPGVDLAGFMGNLIPATLGNIVGGALIAGLYWFAYLRGRPADT